MQICVSVKERQLIEIVSSRIRDRRRDQRLSLDRLATLVGVSKGMLVQIEQGQANSSIVMLCKVVAALGASVADLVQVVGQHLVEVMPVALSRLLWRGSKGGSATLLVGSAGLDMLELWRWELRSGERYEVPAYSQGMQELLHVVRGRLALAFGEVSYVIEIGGSAVVHIDRSYAYVCDGKRPAHFTMVVAEWHTWRESCRARQERTVVWSRIAIAASLVLVVSGSFVYHIVVKSVLKAFDPVALVIGVYAVALFGSMVVYAAVRPGSLLVMMRFWHSAIAVVGFGALMIEFGFFFIYRAAWPVSMASVIINGLVVVLLVLVGVLLFGEAIIVVKLVGVALCLFGVSLLQC